MGNFSKHELEDSESISSPFAIQLLFKSTTMKSAGKPFDILLPFRPRMEEGPELNNSTAL